LLIRFGSPLTSEEVVKNWSSQKIVFERDNVEYNAILNRTGEFELKNGQKIIKYDTETGNVSILRLEDDNLMEENFKIHR
jgi:carotenoid cleavage dioxygenase-like enzyme